MSWIKATVSFIHAIRHPDEVAREVEAELRLHIEMRTRSNVEAGMQPDEAQSAAKKSFGDFDRVKNSCCEIRRALPFDYTPLRMGLHVAIAALAGFAALWAVNLPHHNFTGVLRQLIAIAVLTYLFIVVQRARARRRSADDRGHDVFGAQCEMVRINNSLTSEVSNAPFVNIVAHDEQGLTPVERMFKS
jgi:hypothetical protein